MLHTMNVLTTGLNPGELRSREHPILARDQGHSVVKSSARRNGASWDFTYSVTCQCGKRLTSRRGATSLWYRLDDHRRAELGE